MKTQVLYKSRTGNTEKLAKAIFEAVPGQCKDIAPLEGQTDYEMGDIYFIGFWTDRGSASVEVLDYLGSLQGKKIALFGTCGMGNDLEYYKKSKKTYVFLLRMTTNIWALISVRERCRFLCVRNISA